MKKGQSQPGVILVAEDGHDDFILLQFVYLQTDLLHKLHWVKNGRGVVDYLQSGTRNGDAKAFSRPGLLLLDLKMPEMNGFEVLQWLRNSAEWSNLPVVVHSGSDLPQDRKKASDLGARAYYAKSCTLKDTEQMLRHICGEWLDHGVAPQNQ